MKGENMNTNSGGGKQEYVYIAVSNDKWELPIAVAETRVALARILGIDPTAITHSLQRAEKGTGKNKFYKVDITDID